MSAVFSGYWGQEEVRTNTGTGIPKWVACEQTVLHRLGPNKIELDWKHVL